MFEGLATNHERGGVHIGREIVDALHVKTNPGSSMTMPRLSDDDF
jgi:hypothetical protein